MGFECPVCGEPQADAEHLANHLAFSAMLGREDHETWLDEHAPDWGGMGPDDLAPVVVEHASEVELPEGIDGEHDHGRFEDGLVDHGGYGRDQRDAETEQILDEAQELTARMYEAEESQRDEE